MSEPVKPALSAEEWATLGPNGRGHPPFPLMVDEVLCLDERGRQRVAASALYGTAYGFTREHVTALVWARDALATAADRRGGHLGAMMNRLADQADEALERIAALLPPEHMLPEPEDNTPLDSTVRGLALRLPPRTPDEP